VYENVAATKATTPAISASDAVGLREGGRVASANVRSPL
jgi:hypothetical protein